MQQAHAKATEYPKNDVPERFGRLITAVSSVTKVLMVAGVDVTDGVTVVMSTGKI